jgi:apolipoprotein N-acyltransferase
VYDAYGSRRIVWLDGPWWLAALLAGAVGVLTFAPGAWKWLALPFIVGLAWIPITLHWGLGIGRSFRAFREGFRGR